MIRQIKEAKRERQWEEAAHYRQQRFIGVGVVQRRKQLYRLLFIALGGSPRNQCLPPPPPNGCEEKRPK